jgi:murein DD-endopeptidase MepM/ murein hydrolase activator NlpD
VGQVFFLIFLSFVEFVHKARKKGKNRGDRKKKRSKPMQKKNVFVKLKEDKGARAIAITVVAMLVVLTAIIVTTVVANRAAQNHELPLPDDSTQAGINDPAGEEKPEEKPDEQPDLPGDQQTGADVLPSRFLLPVYGVMQKKHDTEVQVFSPTMGDYRMHLGIDVGTADGASVSAMADGVISQVWEDVRMGQCVAIKHGGECYTIYKNLAAELPEGTVVGAAVKAGDVIGTVGESAMVEVAEEPHLHLEMTVNGLQVDPMDYLDEEAKATLNQDVNYEDVS